MKGREQKEYNDLFFLCSLLEYIRRKTKNRSHTVVTAIGGDRLQHYLDLADVYHCDNIDRVADELIEKSGLSAGTFDNISAAEYKVPTHWEIGRIYQRLITAIAERQHLPLIDALQLAYHSPITGNIENYDSSMYYENPEYIYQSYLHGSPL